MVTLDEGWAVEIQRREYTPPVSLLSVPAAKAASPQEVLDELSHLPLSTGEAARPYLEIKVFLAGPEPLLRQQIEEVLADKAVRLARIVSVYRQADESTREEEVLAAGLQEMSPLQIVKATFENQYQEEMPEELEMLFYEVCQTVNNEINE